MHAFNSPVRGNHVYSGLSILAAVAALAVAGCGAKSTPVAKVTAETEAAHSHEHGHAHGEHGHTHSHDEWWCAEHGVPEHLCAQCDPKVAAALKKQGDWCKEHDRPDSQCFICHPENAAGFAALYEAKYNKQPPKREDETEAASPPKSEEAAPPKSEDAEAAPKS